MLSGLKNSVLAVSMLSGTIIGVGFFSLPYITLKVGIGAMLGYFLILGFLVILIHLLFGEVAISTPDFMRLPGYAKFHLGEWGRVLAFISIVFGLFGSILAYLVVGGQFLENLLSPILGGGNFIYTLIYFIFGASLIFFGIKAISQIEFLGMVVFLAILFSIFSYAFPYIKIANFFLMDNWKLNLFLPYGPILFSLWGTSLIPEAEEILGRKKNLLRKVIPLAILIPMFVYLLFIFLILGVAGDKTTEFGLTGLQNFFPQSIFSLALILGLIATFTSFIALGLALQNIFRYDLKIKKNLAFAITCFIPLILFLAGFKNFIPIISFVGGFSLGLEGILILLMYQKIKPKNLFVYPLVLIFLGGIIYQIIYYVK